jgi:hypothetical protein
MREEGVESVLDVTDGSTRSNGQVSKRKEATGKRENAPDVHVRLGASELATSLSGVGADEASCCLLKPDQLYRVYRALKRKKDEPARPKATTRGTWMRAARGTGAGRATAETVEKEYQHSCSFIGGRWRRGAGGERKGEEFRK